MIRAPNALSPDLRVDPSTHAALAALSIEHLPPHRRPYCRQSPKNV
jgi:hypothetical protein